LEDLLPIRRIRKSIPGCWNWAEGYSRRELIRRGKLFKSLRG